MHLPQEEYMVEMGCQIASLRHRGKNVKEIRFIVLMRQQNNRTDSMIIGIGAAHAGAPAVYYMGAV